MKMMWMFLFMILPIVALVYIGWHVWVLLPLSWVWKAVILIVGLACFSLLFLSIGRKLESLPLAVAQWGYEICTSSIIVLLYLAMLFLVLDLGRLCRLVPASLLHHNGAMALGIVVVMVGLFVYGNLHYRHKVRVPMELKAPVPLPKTYKAVMASDLHLGYHNPRKELARWVDLMNAEHPDFILIAGDIIDGSMRPLTEEAMAEEFHRLQAPVYACLGNHEYFSGSPAARQFYQDAGIRLLVDEKVVVDSALVIIGRDDRSNPHRQSLAALVGDDKSRDYYTIVLDHQPYHLDRSEAAGVDFQLSGHSHRGQIWPITWITDHIYECSWGECQRGKTRFYVSSGLGIWGGKYRIGSQSEYVTATIEGK